MARLDHLSYSSVSSYLLCARSWRYHYIDQVKVPRAVALVVGSVWHRTVEDFLPAPDQQPFQGFLEANLNRYMESDEDLERDSAEGQDVIATVRRMAKSDSVQQVLAELKANYDIECPLEQRVELHVPDVPIPIVGYIDIVTRDGVPGDIKTASRMWSQGQADSELQPLFYLAAFNQAGIRVPNNEFRYYIFTKTKRPDAKVLKVHHGPIEFFFLFEMIREVWEAIEKGVFPMNCASWKCSSSYCEYYSICRGRFS